MPLTSFARRGFEIGREMKAVVRQGQLISQGQRGMRGVGHARGQGERLVVFVHGFMARGPVFDPMRRRVEALSREDAREVETLDLSYGPLDRFDVVCERAQSIIRAHAKERPVTLVGHSLGGLISRWVVQEMRLKSVDRLITLASPHAGTHAAGIGVSSLLQAIQPGSAILTRLARETDALRDVTCTALVAGRDRMITPPSSSGEFPGAEVIWMDDLGHNEMLFDPRVIELVAKRV